MAKVNVDPILVVDDDPDMRSMLRQALNRQDYPVETAASGAEALDKIQADTFSLVVADVRMPELSGLDMLEELKQRFPELPVIIMTGYGSVNNAVEAMQKGAADYLLKPFSNELLYKAVDRFMAKAATAVKALASSQDPVISELPHDIITQDPLMKRLLDTARQVAASNATVLIQGESGTGKELLARYIHLHSGAAQAPYLAVNCAALPESLAESELFGHEKGAFTGAVLQKPGKFEMAQNGTIVLDEISEMALPLQAKLLRVLQERQVDRVGGRNPIAMTARVIAISNINLKDAVHQGRFRKDLYYRVNVIPLTVPPLRQRRQDIALLARFFVHKFVAINRLDPVELSAAAMTALTRHDWPGNVRELEHSIERAVWIHADQRIEPQDLILDSETGGADAAQATALQLRAGITVREMEKQLIFKTLESVNDNRTHAAEMLGISIRTLRNKLHEYRENLSAV